MRLTSRSASAKENGTLARAVLLPTAGDILRQPGAAPQSALPAADVS